MNDRGNHHYKLAMQLLPLNMLDRQILTCTAFWSYMLSCTGVIISSRVLHLSGLYPILASLAAGLALFSVLYWRLWVRMDGAQVILWKDNQWKLPLFITQQFEGRDLRSIVVERNCLLLGFEKGFTQKIPFYRFRDEESARTLARLLMDNLDEESASRIKLSDSLQKQRSSFPLVSASFSALLAMIFFLIPHAESVGFSALDRQLIGHGEIYRLFSYGLVHLNPVHLIANLCALLSFGYLIEGILGRGLFAAIFLSGIFFGGMLSYLSGSPETYTVGASAGIYAIVGALFSLLLQPHRFPLPATICRIPPTWQATLIIIMLLPVIPGTDELAHLGGFMSGVSSFYLLSRNVNPVDLHLGNLSSRLFSAFFLSIFAVCLMMLLLGASGVGVKFTI